MVDTTRESRESVIVGQATIVVTEAPEGRFMFRSFASPEGGPAAGEWCDRTVRLVEAAVQGRVVDVAADERRTKELALELARLRRIEVAATKVLATGQAHYDEHRYWPSYVGTVEALWIGDLVPGPAMQGLREAVEGPGPAVVESDAEEGAEEKRADPATLFGPHLSGVDPQARIGALPPRSECPDCECPTGTRGMCDAHFDALVELVRRA